MKFLQKLHKNFSKNTEKKSSLQRFLYFTKKFGKHEGKNLFALLVKCLQEIVLPPLSNVAIFHVIDVKVIPSKSRFSVHLIDHLCRLKSCKFDKKCLTQTKILLYEKCMWLLQTEIHFAILLEESF